MPHRVRSLTAAAAVLAGVATPLAALPTTTIPAGPASSTLAEKSGAIEYLTPDAAGGPQAGRKAPNPTAVEYGLGPKVGAGQKAPNPTAVEY
jgi:hypothetical protein